MKSFILRLAMSAGLVASQVALAQGQPIVVLEYPGYSSTSMSGLNQDNPFVYDPDHIASHRVQPDETLSHIVTAYYAERRSRPVDRANGNCEEKQSAFVRGNPNFLYADKVLHLPSLNEMKNLVLGSQPDHAHDQGHSMQNEIFFIGG